jgi:hypothetical protein
MTREKSHLQAVEASIGIISRCERQRGTALTDLLVSQGHVINRPKI